MRLHLSKKCGCAVVQSADPTQPLWLWPPSSRLAVLHARRRDGVILDDEPVGDPEYA